jgi:hypothetical protein
VKTDVLSLAPAMELELPRRWQPEIELSDEDLERVVGGLERVWLPSDDEEPLVPGLSEL